MRVSLFVACCLLQHLARARGCRGFLNVSKIALEKAVDSIFADQGMVGLARALYCHQEWRNGVSTQSYLLTLDDYIGDLKEWLDTPFFKRALEVRYHGPHACVQACTSLRFLSSTPLSPPQLLWSTHKGHSSQLVLRKGVSAFLCIDLASIPSLGCHVKAGV